MALRWGFETVLHLALAMDEERALRWDFEMVEHLASPMDEEMAPSLVLELGVVALEQTMVVQPHR